MSAKRRANKRGSAKRGARSAAPARRRRKRKPDATKRRSGARKAKKLRRAKRTNRARGAKRTARKPVRRKPPTPTVSKAALRKRLRAERTRLAPETQRRAAQRLLANLTSTRLFLAARRVACYLPNDGEIDASPVLERLWRMGKEAYLPVLSPPPHDRLWFAPARPGMQLVPNRFGIPEPRVPAREMRRAEQLDLVLLPVVAFDAKGNRLGRGAGFYDKTLAFLRGRRFLRKPHLLGLAHDFQRVPSLPADPWDVPLDGVVTERAVYYTDR